MNQPIANYKNHRFPPEIMPVLSGSITGFHSACVTLRKCCWNAGSLYPMRPSADGAEDMVPTMPGAFAESHLPAVISGISTKLQFGSMAGDAGCGGLSTKTDMCSKKSCRFAAIPRLPDVC